MTELSKPIPFDPENHSSQPNLESETPSSATIPEDAAAPDIEGQSALPLKWVAIDNPFTWQRLNGLDDDDEEDEVKPEKNRATDILAQLLLEGVDAVKEKPANAENYLRYGDVFRLPKNFEWTEKVYQGTNHFVLNVDREYVDFKVDKVEYDHYIVSAVDDAIRYSFIDTPSRSRVMLAQIYMPKYLAQADNPDKPISWRSLVLQTGDANQD